jgi:hypothetical protein
MYILISPLQILILLLLPVDYDISPPQILILLLLPVDYDISPPKILILLLLPVDYDISPFQIFNPLVAEEELKTGVEEWRNIIIHW